MCRHVQYSGRPLRAANRMVLPCVRSADEHLQTRLVVEPLYPHAQPCAAFRRRRYTAGIARHSGAGTEATVSLTEQIKERAYALGFDLVRVTSAEPMAETEAVLKERIGADYFAGMDWFTAARAEVAANPRALLPTARSVLSLGTFYLTD